MLFSVSTRCKPPAQALVRHYAKPADASMGDARLNLIRRTLYPGNIRNKATPTGTWRPDVRQTIQRAIPSVQAHDTIERAWLLHRRHVRKRREEEIKRKFECMRKAMDELRSIDLRLYMEANKVEDPRRRSPQEMEKFKSLPGLEGRAFDARIRGLFPREYRVPVDTPSKAGWNYEWTPVERPL
ncbi:hypothetical protein MIND_00522800 [Mycena indigotica]|uniref:Large ribosomal subunit protein mL40 n=1 Tax=Mycena indigotica TaxID=2126181 RepID=A0A8H6SWL6_9AGAR|nr:uncharacterized protein MIND_00522800 [Mycena indigotica]KAF7307288.1 hypothetical protein MIND_00522800 [Mycena indigotica]